MYHRKYPNSMKTTLRKKEEGSFVVYPRKYDIHEGISWTIWSGFFMKLSGYTTKIS
jgi:hypothetical protein